MNSEIHAEQEYWISVLNSIPNTAAHIAFGFDDAKAIYDGYAEE